MTTAYFTVIVLCLLQPALAFGLGVLVGRHGFRHALTLILVRIFGQAVDREQAQ